MINLSTKKGDVYKTPPFSLNFIFYQSNGSIKNPTFNIKNKYFYPEHISQFSGSSKEHEISFCLSMLSVVES
jgi:hypothetical protein